MTSFLLLGLGLALWLAFRLRYMTETDKEAEPIFLPLYPASNNGVQYTGTIDLMKCNRFKFYCGTGTVGGGGNVVFQVQSSNNSNGSTNTNVSGGAVTISASSQIATVEGRADQISARYVQVSASVNTNASTDFCIPVGTEVRQHPTTLDDASVTNRVVI